MIAWSIQARCAANRLYEAKKFIPVGRKVEAETSAVGQQRELLRQFILQTPGFIWIRDGSGSHGGQITAPGIGFKTETANNHAEFDHHRYESHKPPPAICATQVAETNHD
ncbi:hypothetical protein CK215_29845 [Mesorhizobium sp. WSM3864]|nr:hypothetical protein CK215_29845 [Mesorhizobium sp. WSM3864]